MCYWGATSCLKSVCKKETNIFLNLYHVVTYQPIRACLHIKTLPGSNMADANEEKYEQQTKYWIYKQILNILYTLYVFLILGKRSDSISK